MLDLGFPIRELRPGRPEGLSGEALGLNIRAKIITNTTLGAPYNN